MRTLTRFPLVALVALALAVSPAGRAQQPAGGGGAAGDRVLQVKEIMGGKALTPEYQVKRLQANARVKEWYQIVTTYETDPEWLDAVEFTYYALVRNTKNPKGPPQTLFKGDATYINVQKGRHKSDMFLHPSTLARFGEVQAVAVLVKVEGRLVAVESKPSSRERWWEQLAPVEGLLLNRGQTPFAPLYFDDYEAMRPPVAK